MRSKHSRRTVPTKRSAMALVRGALIGVRMIPIRSDRNTWSKLALNLASRSRMSHLAGTDRSPSAQASWRACWVTYGSVGLVVAPATWTFREPCSMKKST